MVAYVIFFIIPVNPAQLACGQRASPECIRNATQNLGLDKPVYEQYWKFLTQLVVHHDLGKSYFNRQSVNTTVLNAAPVTASLVLGGAVLWMLIALADRDSLRAAAAVVTRPNVDGVRADRDLGAPGLDRADPVVRRRVQARLDADHRATATSSTRRPSCGGPVQWAWHMILPWITFAVLFAALYVRMIRANVMEASDEDYVRTARAKGAPEQVVIRSHILRNALLPVVTMLGMDIGVALGGAIFTETIFALPGLGQTALQAITNFDLPTVQGIVVFATIAIIVFNLVVDLLYAVIDPRIRLS